MDSSCGMPGWGGGDTRTAMTVRLPGVTRAGDVEHAADEGAANVAEPAAVDPDFGGVVDALEGQRELLAVQMPAGASNSVRYQ